MANTPRSRKAKGRKLQNNVRDLILEHFPMLEKDDVTSTLMGGSGVDIQLSPAARKVFPYSIECKNQEALNVWNALSQAEKNCKENTSPALVFKRNNSKTYIAIELDKFIEIYSKLKKNPPDSVDKIEE